MFASLFSVLASACVPDVAPASTPRPFVAPIGLCELHPGTAAVSLTYDDTLSSQIDIAAPALRKHGLWATFFVTDTAEHADAWRELHAEGHELAAHTLRHPCPASNSWVKPGNASEDYDARRMGAELDANIAELRSLGQSPPFTFAYPCGVHWMGDAHESYVPLVQARFIAARGVMNQAASANVDVYDVPAYLLTGSGSELIEVVKRAEAKGEWVVFVFHGVGGDYLPVSEAAHEELLAYLQARSPHVRVAPFGAVAACLMHPNRSAP